MSVLEDFIVAEVGNVDVAGRVDALAERMAEARDLAVQFAGFDAVIVNINRIARIVGDVKQPLLRGIR
jgi:hypothetical protein